MTTDAIPGMAVGVAVAGKSYVFNYGVASKVPRTSVTGDTLFEIGSVSKTFTATLVSWAQVQQRLSLSDTTAEHLPELRGTAFGNLSLLSLGTHTPGGLPLQVPDDITDQGGLMGYFRQWHSTYQMGTHRTYSNIGIGLLGLIAAKSMGEDFRALMQQRLLAKLGLKHSYIVIPANERAEYAWGYTDTGRPIRMKAGMLADETYGIRTTAADMIRFVQENIDPSGLAPSVRRAITQTHTGYFHAGPMTQDLIWEQYPCPVALQALQAGNSYHMIFDATPVSAIDPPEDPQQRVLLDKTGSTSGFGTYVAFIPLSRLGIVLLANKDYPIPDRVAAAYRILGALASVDRTVSAKPISDEMTAAGQNPAPRATTCSG